MPAPTRSLQQLGTITATVDGAERTWYLLAGVADDPGTTTAGWMMLPNAPGPMVVLVGFDTPTPPFDSFERDENGAILGYGDYEGSLLSLGVRFDGEPGPLTLSFPDATSEQHLMSFLPSAAGPYHLVDDGSLQVTAASRAGDTISIAGTFTGTFRPFREDGSSIEMTAGSFNAEGLVEIALPER